MNLLGTVKAILTTFVLAFQQSFIRVATGRAQSPVEQVVSNALTEMARLFIAALNRRIGDAPV